ncbi:MAG TPA: hypothetical protein VLA89_15905 [Gemmatimonadales bacterium]|nr:hypothetical protein [Gemmatimonadales bacterium]
MIRSMNRNLDETMAKIDAEAAKRADPNYYPESITDAWVLMLHGVWTEEQYERYRELWKEGLTKGYRTLPEPPKREPEPWWAWPVAIILGIIIFALIFIVWNWIGLSGQNSSGY